MLSPGQPDQTFSANISETLDEMFDQFDHVLITFHLTFRETSVETRKVQCVYEGAI